MTTKILMSAQSDKPEREQSRGRFRSGPGQRLVSGILPAAGVTFGLFTFMYVAIGGYEAPETPEELPVLSKITPDISDKRPNPSGFEKPNKIEAKAPPPRPAPYTPSAVDLFIPTDHKIGGPPERIDRADFTVLDNIVVAPEKTVTPITPPNVVYPPRLADKRIEGSCDVRFDVSARGEPYNIRPECTHSGFERSAKRAVASSRFSPKVSNGKPVERRNVVYPIEYRMND